MNKKKGLSPIIATVLLIALVLILILIIFLWARGFIGEKIQKGDQPISTICDEVSFEVTETHDSVSATLQISNRGNVPINTVEVRSVNGGNSDLVTYPASIDAGRTAEISISLPSGTEKIIVYPVLLGNVKGKSTNKQYTCRDNSKLINLN